MNNSDKNLREIIARNLRLKRELCPFTQTELAERTGTTRQTIGAIESGKSSFDVETFLRVCDALDIKPSDFFLACEGELLQKGRKGQ